MSKVTKITQKELVKEVATTTGLPQCKIKEVLDTTRDVVTNMLANSVTEESEEVQVNLSRGLSIKGKYIPAMKDKEVRNPKTGETEVKDVDAKIKVSGVIGDTVKKAVNGSLADDTEDVE